MCICRFWGFGSTSHMGVVEVKVVSVDGMGWGVLWYWYV